MQVEGAGTSRQGKGPAPAGRDVVGREAGHPPTGMEEGAVERLPVSTLLQRRDTINIISAHQISNSAPSPEVEKSIGYPLICGLMMSMESTR